MIANETLQVTFSTDEIGFAVNAIRDLSGTLDFLVNQVRSMTPGRWTPEELRIAQQLVSELNIAIAHRTSGGKIMPCDIRIDAIGLLKLAIEERVHGIVQQMEQTAALTHSEEPQARLSEQLTIGESLLKQHSLLAFPAAPRYTLVRYFNLETVQKKQGETASLEPRTFDDKFHILISQSLFMKDLRFYREQCTVRDRPVSVAYIDIDEFKTLNTALTETRVDKEILPKFMGALEAFVFGRGLAYREGGDEYLVLLPGATHQEAGYFFESLRKHLEALEYGVLEMPTGPTVSIGVCTAEAAHRRTALQIQQLANRAKAFAKERGRNRVAVYKVGQDPTVTSLEILDVEQYTSH